MTVVNKATIFCCCSAKHAISVLHGIMNSGAVSQQWGKIKLPFSPLVKPQQHLCFPFILLYQKCRHPSHCCGCSPICSFVISQSSVNPFITSHASSRSVTSQPIKEHHHCSGACSSDTLNPVYHQRLLQAFNPARLPQCLLDTNWAKTCSVLYSIQHGHRDKSGMSRLERTIFKHLAEAKLSRKQDNGWIIIASAMKMSPKRWNKVEKDVKLLQTAVRQMSAFSKPYIGFTDNWYTYLISVLEP